MAKTLILPGLEEAYKAAPECHPHTLTRVDSTHLYCYGCGHTEDLVAKTQSEPLVNRQTLLQMTDVLGSRPSDRLAGGRGGSRVAAPSTPNAMTDEEWDSLLDSIEAIKIAFGEPETAPLDEEDAQTGEADDGMADSDQW